LSLLSEAERARAQWGAIEKVGKETAENKRTDAKTPG
jgi:hypothetical protein